MISRRLLLPAAVAATFALVWPSCANADATAGSFLQAPAPALLEGLRAEHPRLTLTGDRLRELKAVHASDTLLQRYVREVLAEADELLPARELEYEIPDGLRLLRVSRECVRRVSTLAFAYRWTEDRKYLDAALRDLRAVCAFKDWNPRHFLDTAEMTHGVGLGYDWLYTALDAETRSTLREALVRLGLTPGRAAYEKGAFRFPKAVNNWNQVCNMGLIVGALAVADEEPELAAAIVSGALASLPRAMANYAPDGAWMEGPDYWSYATSYVAHGASALETALGKDLGVSAWPGLAETGAFSVHGAGPTGILLSFADAGTMSRSRPRACLMYLARTLCLQDDADAEHEALRDHRASAFDIAWYVPPSGRKAVRALDRLFRGPVEVATMRTAWDDPGALWVGAKAGFNKVNHGHLDLGTFEIDALGVRWAVDLGKDDYNLPGYFGERRWTYYRLQSRSHNVVTLDGHDQKPDGTARVVRWQTAPDGGAVVIDATKAWDGLTRAQRGVRLLRRERAVLVQDELALTGTHDVEWGITTAAEIEVEADGSALLTLDGRQMRVKALAPSGARFEAGSAERPRPEKGNTGFRRLTLSVKGASGEQRIAILFVPFEPGRPAPQVPITPLEAWPGQL